VDRTGLAGKFDFNLEWTPDANGAVTPALGAEVEEAGLTFEQALRDQLGMKIESQKGQVAVWVVDRLEKLAEN
jgi:uncharacterized protein (TIGR03435 family)